MSIQKIGHNLITLSNLVNFITLDESEVQNSYQLLKKKQLKKKRIIDMQTEARHTV